jgi:peptidyl-prolyl cis-trans isomerase D
MDLLRDKAMTVIRDSVALTPTEVSDAQSLIARQSAPDATAAQTARDRILQDYLLQKQERALAAYEQALKSRLAVKIHKEML